MNQDPPADEEVERIKRRVTGREEARQWIQKKRQERYEAQLMELDAKRQEEELKKKHKEEFEATMNQLKKRANVNKAPSQRPPSLMSKLHKTSHTAAIIKSNIAKSVHSSQKISPKSAPLSNRSPKTFNVKKTSKDNIRSPMRVHSKNSLQCSLNDSQLVDSKASSENHLLKSDHHVLKCSAARSVRGSPRSEKGQIPNKSPDGLFSSRTEKQKILESCLSNLTKPVTAVPMKVSTQPSRLPLQLSLHDLQKNERETHKRKMDQEFASDLKKPRPSSRSVLVSSTTSDHNSKYYHFSYVDPPAPSPSPLNVSLCSEFNETSSSRALLEFNSKVQMLKNALSEEFTHEAFVGTLEKSLDKDAISKIKSPTEEVMSTNQVLSNSYHRFSQMNKITRDKAPNSLTSDPDNPADSNATDAKENRELLANNSCDLTRFRHPAPFNFTSTMKARLNMLTNEKHRDHLSRKKQQAEPRKRYNADKSEDISDLIAQYVTNCQRNVAQIKTSCGLDDTESLEPLSCDVTRPTLPRRMGGIQDTGHPRFHRLKGKSPATSQFNTFTLNQLDVSHQSKKLPANRTYDRALKPLALNVEDLKLQFRTTSNSTSSSCIEFSEVRHMQNQGLNTSQIPERDSGDTDTNVPDEMIHEQNVNTTHRIVNDTTHRKFDMRSISKHKPEDVVDTSNCNASPDLSVKTFTKKNNPKTHKGEDFTPSTTITHDTRDLHLMRHRSTIPSEFQQARKKSAFYVVPPSLQSLPLPVDCLVPPDITLTPRGMHVPLEMNFRRISSTPTSSLKSVETFKDSDSLSEIMQPDVGHTELSIAKQESNVETFSRDKTPAAEVPAPKLNTSSDKCTKPTRSSLPRQQPEGVTLPFSQSCTSDTLCDPLNEMSVATSKVKNKQKSIFTVKNLNSPKFSLELLGKMILAEEERQIQSKVILKLKSKAITDRIISELSNLESEKKVIKECIKPGSAEQNSDRLRNLKKKQRGLLIRLNQEQEHLNSMSKQLLAQSQNRIQELSSQYNHLRTQLDTKSVLKLIDDSFKFTEDVTDSDLTSVHCSDFELSSNVGKLKAFSSLPEGLNRGDMAFGKPEVDKKYIQPPIQPKVLKDQCTSPLGFTYAEHPSLETPTSSAAAPAVCSRKSEAPAIPMRAALYPKYLRRLSSGSEDSFIYSHNETISDQSDLELRIRTLKDQLTKRKLESERLKKELKTVRAENLKVKEASLLQQIRFYDKHIKASTQELEREKENLTRPAHIMVKPLILKPHNKVATKPGNNSVINTTTTNMSSLEETSDQTHSSHDYLKETFDTESDKLDASDGTNVKDKESNESLTPSVHTVTEEEHTRVDVAEENTKHSESTLKLEALDTNDMLIKTRQNADSIQPNQTFKAHYSVETDGEVSKPISNVEIIAPKDDGFLVEQIENQSLRHSGTASDILTELDEQSFREEIKSSEMSKDSLTSEKNLSEINEIESPIETARESFDKDSNTEIGTSVETNIESEYEEKNYESEVLQVSFKEKTINDTFIVHEESLNFERKKIGEHRTNSESEVIEEVSNGLGEEEHEEIPVLNKLELSPQETDHSLVEEIPSDRTGDSKDTSEISTCDSKQDKYDSKADPKKQESADHSQANVSFSEINPGNESEHLAPADTSLNDSCNISDYRLDTDFLTLDNYNLIHLSPSKAPETPFLHALNRDYQMSRKIQLEKISNEIVNEQLNASIESMVTLYRSRRGDKPKLRRADSIRGEEEESVEEEIVQEDVDDSLGEKFDFLALHSNQKELPWTSQDDWYSENFGLPLQVPPAVVAEVLLQKERQIDQEIEKIKQLTSTNSSLNDLESVTRRKLFSGAYPYLREIPDKPPPPYIEPASSVPSSEEEIVSIVEAMVDSLRNPDKEVPSSSIACIQMYYSFLYDLTRDVYNRLTTPLSLRPEAALPWLQPRVKTKPLYKKVPTNPQELTAHVVSEVCELLSLRPSSKRDNFILRWSRPKRDPVDEIIVQESKAEEPMWVSYHVEEVEIKNEMTEVILEELLEETVRVFQTLTAGRSQA